MLQLSFHVFPSICCWIASDLHSQSSLHLPPLPCKPPLVSMPWPWEVIWLSADGCTFLDKQSPSGHQSQQLLPSPHHQNRPQAHQIMNRRSSFSSPRSSNLVFEGAQADFPSQDRLGAKIQHLSGPSCSWSKLRCITVIIAISTYLVIVEQEKKRLRGEEVVQMRCCWARRTSWRPHCGLALVHRSAWSVVWTESCCCCPWPRRRCVMPSRASAGSSKQRRRGVVEMAWWETGCLIWSVFKQKWQI